MKVQTGRDVGKVWSVTALVFISTVVVVRVMGRSPQTTMQALWVGYVGLAAVGAAIFVTGAWVYQHGPTSSAAKAALYVLLPVAAAFWLLAIIFPFL
jgi:hypothetical protein